MSEVEKLEPCPFCGGVARLWAQAGAKVVIGCESASHHCPVQPHLYGTEGEAIAAWNRRATLQSQARRVEELEAALRRVRSLAGDFDSPVMAAWDRARATIIEGNRGSLPRDIMESGLSEIWEVADEALAARSALSEGSVSSRELAPPDESGDACGATERAEG